MARCDPSDGRPRTAAGEHGLHLPNYGEWTADAGEVGLDLGPLRAELDRELARERGFVAWLRSRPTPVRATLAGLVLSAMVVATMGLWPRVDYALYPSVRMALVVGVIALLIGIDLILVVWPLQLPAAPRWLARSAAFAAPLTLLALYVLPPAHSNARSLAPPNLSGVIAGAMRCWIVGTLVGAGVFALFRMLDRGGSRRALLMAAGAGSAANLLLHLHCAMVSPAHLLVGHLGVLVPCFLAAAWLDRRGAAARA